MPSFEPSAAASPAVWRGCDHGVLLEQPQPARGARLLQDRGIAGVSRGDAVEQVQAAGRRDGRLVAVVVGQLPQQPWAALRV